MIVFQLVGGSAIFTHLILLRTLRPEAVFAAFLAFTVLAVGGLVSPSSGIRLLLVLLKCGFCLLLIPYTGLPLLLLPPVGMELPGILARLGKRNKGGKEDRAGARPKSRHIGGPGGGAARGLADVSARAALFAAAVCAVLIGVVFLLPAGFALPYLGILAVSVYQAVRELGNERTAARLSARVRFLERELALAEAKRASIEKASAGQEILIKFEERERIAQKLHDDLGHTITGSIMQLEAAGLLLSEDPVRVREIIERVSCTLKEGLAAIRLNLRTIKPEPARLGLQRLRGLLDDFEAAYGRKTGLATDGDIQGIPAAVWRVIEENLQEALTNMLKHSTGNLFRCSISVMNRMYKAEFRDNGSPPPGYRRGMGLEGMEARTREAGGTLIIDTSQGFSEIMLFGKEAVRDGDTGTGR